jgi:hypothetical protein
MLQHPYQPAIADFDRFIQQCSDEALAATWRSAELLRAHFGSSVLGLLHVNLNVTDLMRSLRFYTEASASQSCPIPKRRWISAQDPNPSIKSFLSSHLQI